MYLQQFVRFTQLLVCTIEVFVSQQAHLDNKNEVWYNHFCKSIYAERKSLMIKRIILMSAICASLALAGCKSDSSKGESSQQDSSTITTATNTGGDSSIIADAPTDDSKPEQNSSSSDNSGSTETTGTNAG